MGPAGFEPATQRIRAQLQDGLYFTLFHIPVMNRLIKSILHTYIIYSVE
jgi:hypothetical protein